MLIASKVKANIPIFIMKILKAKSLLLSATAILFIAMFITSCQQEEIIIDDQLGEVVLQERNPCFSGDSADDCYACYEWLNEQDEIAMESQISKCIERGGDCDDCTNDAIEWYGQALKSNAQYLVDCLSGFSNDEACKTCYTDFTDILTKGDVTGMVSQVQNCIEQGGDCEECKDNALAWYGQASETNIEFLQDCLD